MSTVFSSRRIWTAIIAMIVNIATLIVSTYIHDPAVQQIVTTVIVSFDTLAGVIIGLLTIDDINGIKAKQAVEVAAVNAGSHPLYPASVAPTATAGVPSPTKTANYYEVKEPVK